MLGNKGAAAVSFTYLSYSFLFISCHLAAGQKQSNYRNIDFERINKLLKIPGIELANPEKDTITDKFDVCIWLGDFNYRIDLPMNEVHQMLVSNTIERVLDYDQFYKQIEEEKLDFNHFFEARINFYPTYKFIPSSDNYDIESKQPGWTDRIIYKSNSECQLNLLKYNWIRSVNFSDHKPVCADFVFNIKKCPVGEVSSIVINTDSKSKACSIF